MSDETLIAELRRDEGVRRSAYKDSLGLLTIGVGRLIDPSRNAGLSDDEIDYLLANDVKRVQAELDQRIPWWRSMGDVRSRVFANMAFQLGTNGLLNFKKAVAAAKAGRYAECADQMLDSAWAKSQTPDRAKRLAQMMRSGRA